MEYSGLDGSTWSDNSPVSRVLEISVSSSSRYERPIISVYRGGSWYVSARTCQAAYRFRDSPSDHAMPTWVSYNEDFFMK